MSTPPDPIYQAVVNGDDHTPDGRALASLGKLVREQAKTPAQPDLMPGIRKQLEEAKRTQQPALYGDQTSDAPSDIADAEIDAWYNGDRAGAVASDPLLQRLGSMVRTAAEPPRQPDLLPGVVDRLARNHSSRRASVTLDRVSRWRIWGAVVAGHAAALIALAALHVQLGRGSAPLTPELADARLRERPGFHRIHPARYQQVAQGQLSDSWDLPIQWRDLRGQPQRLFALRGNPRNRASAVDTFAMSASAPVVDGAVAWLTSRVTATGQIKGAAEDPDAQVTAQAAVALALLGQGLDEPQRRQVVGQLINALSDRVRSQGDQLDGRSHAFALLALIEAAVMFEDSLLSAQCEQLLARYGHRLQDDPGQAGLGGIGFVAVEIAALAEMRVPQGLRHRLEQGVARHLPADGSDVGRLGVAAFARQIRGAGHALSTGKQLQQLVTRHPGTQDASYQRLDVWSWYFPTLAMRETRDRRWRTWKDGLEAALLPAFEGDQQGYYWLPAERVRYSAPFAAAGDAMATAMAVLSLQAPYRYFPLRG